LSSCSKEQFTEKDALSLELSRLRAQRTIDSLKTAQEALNRNGLLRYQRVLDSLDRENAGGRVFYTVNVVSGTSGVFTNGRVEEAEGVTGAQVTTSQYGQARTVATTNGIATFELRSGEATVAVTAPNHTTADFTVNLTAAFSGFQYGNAGFGSGTTNVIAYPKNGTTVYVGNVIPLFQLNGDASQMATVRGIARIETDLTNGTPEFANQANAAIGVPVNVAAVIDVERGPAMGGEPFFVTRYLRKMGAGTTNTGSAQGQGSNAGDVGIGRITKIAYGPATTAGGAAPTGSPVNRVAVQADGTYSMLVPATGSGLPVAMKFDEIGANRTYFENGGTTTARFLYGPSIGVFSIVPNGTDGTRVSFRTNNTDAAVTVAYVAQTTAGSFTKDAVYDREVGKTSVGGGGFYAVAPTVTASGTTGTGLALEVQTTDATGFGGGNVGLTVSGVKVTNGGTGYTPVAGENTDGTGSFTRTDIVAVGNGFRVAGATGNAVGAIQVTDGGFGFRYPQPQNVDITQVGDVGTIGGFATATVTAGFTGVLPIVSFGSILPPATSPVALAIPEPSVGTISSIRITSAGTGLTTIPQPVFTYGTPGSLPAVDAANAPLYVSNGSGGVRFNIDAADVDPAENNAAVYEFPTAWGTPGTDYALTNTSIVFSPGTAAFGAAQRGTVGEGYVFVPVGVAGATGGTFGAGITPASFTIAVNTTQNANNAASIPGSISRIDITNGGNYGIAGMDGAAIVFANIAAVPAGSITGMNLQLVVATVPPNSTRTTNSLAALAFAGGSGLALDNYVIATPQPTLGTDNLFTKTFGGTPAGNATLVDATNVNNAVLTVAEALRLLGGSAWLAVFDKPSSGSQGWGIPFIQDNTIKGVRIINPGFGYPASTTAIPMTLVPNPFRKTSAGAPADLTELGPGNAGDFFNLGADVNGTDFPLPAKKDLKGIANATTIGFDLPTQNPYLLFTVTARGSGYAKAPTVSIADGGLTFADISDLLDGNLIDGDINNSTSVGPVIMSDGAVVRVGAKVDGQPDNVGRVDLPQITDPANQAKYIFLSAPAVFVIDNLGAELTTTFANGVNNVTGFLNPATGTQTGGGFFELNNAISNSIATGRYPLAAAFVNQADWKPIEFHRPPVVTITSVRGNGTGVVAQIDPAPTGIRLTSGGLGKIQAITVTNGGTGWGRSNRFGVTVFSVLGGFDSPGTSFAGNPNNQSNERFDVVNGVTYVRDIHYGTGRISPR
jgi:hypothetical protein